MRLIHRTGLATPAILVLLVNRDTVKRCIVCIVHSLV